MSLEAMHAVWTLSQHRGTARLVLLAIADRADKHGKAWPSMAELADRAGITVRQAQRIVRALTDSGEITVDEGGGRHRTSTYNLLLKPDTGTVVSSTENPDADVTVSEAETLTLVTETLTPVSRNPDIDVTRTVKNPQEPSRKRLPTKPRKPRAPDPIWDALVEVLGATPGGLERGRWNAAVRSLKDSGATPDTIRRAATAYRSMPTYADCAMTPTALAANYTVLTGSGNNNGNGNHDDGWREKAAELRERRGW